MAKGEDVRVTLGPYMKARVEKICETLGVSEAEYVRGLIISDLKRGTLPFENSNKDKEGAP